MKALPPSFIYILSQIMTRKSRTILPKCEKNTADWHRVYRVIFKVQYTIRTQPIAAHIFPITDNIIATQTA